MRALIDGDVIVYSIGFMLDERFYTVRGKKCGSKKVANNYADKHNIPRSEIQAHHVPKGTVDDMVREVDVFLNRVSSKTSTSDRRVFITGGFNFRNEQELVFPYKGNRVGAAKPFQYSEIRNYWVYEHGALVLEGMEADDAMGIAQGDDTVICSIDKDMLTVPGMHYNWQKDTFTNQSETAADTFLHRQLITGDRTDNVFGVVPDTPYQAKKAMAILSKMDYINQLRWVGMEYALAFDEPEERLRENYMLLRILRDESELTNPVDPFEY